MTEGFVLLIMLQGLSEVFSSERLVFFLSLSYWHVRRFMSLRRCPGLMHTTGLRSVLMGPGHWAEWFPRNRAKNPWKTGPHWTACLGKQQRKQNKFYRQGQGNLITEKVCTETSKVCLEFFSSGKVILLIFTEAEALTWLNALLLFPFSAVIRDL